MPNLRAILSTRVALLLMGLCIGCHDFGAETSGRGPLLPLSAGNYWTYLVNYPPSAIIDTLAVRIGPELTIQRQGNLYKFWSWWPFLDNYPSGLGLLFNNDPTGLQLIGVAASNDTLLTLTMNFKCPVGVGEKWQVPVVAYNQYVQKLYVSRSRTIECIDIDARVSMPAGEFSCIVYHWRELPEPDVVAEWDYYDYWALGVGWVGRTVVSTVSNHRTVSTVSLYRYNVIGSASPP